MSAGAPDPVPAAPARRARARAGGALLRRLRTVGQLVAHFASRQRWFLLPLVLVLLLAGVLLLATGGLSYVAPFVYSIF
ncbi:MAG: DUF5989 family protein [Kofleriaceae bacterium]